MKGWSMEGWCLSITISLFGAI